MPSTQTRAKRKLGRRLAQLRVDAGRRPEEIALALRKSAGLVSKIENGHVMPDYPTLQVILARCGVVDAAARRSVEELWEEARSSAKPVEVSPGMSLKYRAYLRAEADAAGVLTVEQTVVPGLLQTSAYAAAVQGTTLRQVARDGAKKAVESRMARQRRVHSDSDPLVVHAVVDEAVVRRVAGGVEVMVEQLRHLLVLQELPNVTIQVIPFERGLYAEMVGPFVLLSYADPVEDPPLVYVEHRGGGLWVEDGAEVQEFLGAFAENAGIALSPEETSALIRQRMVELGEAGEW
ncbi:MULTISPECIES: helix-turn-helix transcriptional regulator [Actinosynnema]|uniref:helix-turn-helix domain-containing protein n=1 Tax=Actinosynnema TaxID=40566 RepID=UPI0020A352AC|nr:helix-turn-helix transcriptional regulator [Actinosynnema pretiosum]MCP2099401.1 Helix-turn-helix domain-containing protein [Actinosynnema pretiosum]